MSKKDPRVDAYIAKSADFARPILNHLRSLVHEVCPEVEETMKWALPNFMYKGILCSMAAFKGHCTFGFWRPEMRQIVTPGGKSKKAMGNFGRITALSDLPKSSLIRSFLKQAVKLQDSGRRRPTVNAKKKPVPPIPKDFRQALQGNSVVLRNFEGFPPSHRREYIEWIAGAKREETRQRRIATALQWLTEGKSQNWKYERK